MVRVFGNSVTVKNSGGETRARCVTSCAGSTAFISVVAQTRRGFLSGGNAGQTANMTAAEKFFFCSPLLGYVPGGAPFSQQSQRNYRNVQWAIEQVTDKQQIKNKLSRVQGEGPVKKERKRACRETKLMGESIRT